MPTLLPMIRTVVAAFRTFVLAPIFVIYTLAVAAFIIAYGAFRPAAPVHDRIVKRWSHLFLKIPPVRFEIDGINNVDPKQRYIVVSNHLSMFDIPTLFYTLPLHGRFLSKKEVFKVPLVGRAMRTIGIIEIDRTAGGSSRQAIKEGVQIAAERGYSLIVFPEGTRGDGDELLPFKKGACRIAIDTGLPILPVVIEGTSRISPPGSRLFFRGDAHIVILEPIETTDMTNKDHLNDLLRTLESSMRSVYADLHTSTQA